MNLRSALSAAAAAVMLWTASASALPGRAAAAAPPPMSLEVYEGSSTPSSVGVEPWAAVFIDGKPASLADLRPGMVLSVVVDSQGQASEIFASDRTVSGVASQVRTANGHTYVVIDGTRYEARSSSTVVAEGGSVLGSLLGNTDLVTNNHVTAFLGPDGRIGYIAIG